MRQSVWRVVAAGVVLLLAGCGGGGEGDGGEPGGQGRVTGSLGVAAAGAVVRLDGTALSAVCDANGGFSIGAVPAGEYTVSVETPGGQGGATTVRVSPGQPVQVPPVLLQRAGQLTGLISDTETGAPLAGARVVAWLTPWSDDWAPLVGAEVAAGMQGGRQVDDGQPPAAEPARVALTAADGSYRFGGVAPGSYSLSVTRDGYEAAESGSWVSAGSTGVADLALRPIHPENATVSGQVTGDGPQPGPLAQVRVELWPVGEVGPRPGDVPGGDGTVSTDSDSFAGGGTVGSAPGSVGGVSPMPMPLPDGGLSGGDGVMYWPPFLNVYFAMTDALGQYTIRNVTPGTYQLTLRRYGYAPVARTIVLGTSARKVENAALASRLTTVSGRAVRATASGLVPVAGAEVWPVGGEVYALRQGGSRPTIGLLPVSLDSRVTDAAGRFRVEVKAGDAVLCAAHPDYGWGFASLEVPAGGLTDVSIELQTYDPGEGGPDDDTSPVPLPGGAAGGEYSGLTPTPFE